MASGTKPDGGSSKPVGLCTVSVWLRHTKLETTAKYLHVTTQSLHELNERALLTLVKVRER